MKQPAPSTGRFRELWLTHFKQELSDEQARDYEDKITKLVAFVVRQEMHQHRERAPPP